MPATCEGPEHGPGAPSAPPVLVPGLRWRRVFPGEERQLGLMRHWLVSFLPDCPARDDVITVAGELAGNTVRHTASGRGGWFATEITWHESMVRVAVADCGGPSEPRVIEDLSAEHGRGLLLVRGLSARTGFCGDQRGRLVWADVPVQHLADTGRDPYEAAIGGSEAALARRFGGVPAWFGRSTLQWWALAGSAGLVTAPSARELAGLLRRLSGAPPIVRSPGAGNARRDASQGAAAISTSDQVLRRDAPHQEPASVRQTPAAPATWPTGTREPTQDPRVALAPARRGHVRTWLPPPGG